MIEQIPDDQDECILNRHKICDGECVSCPLTLEQRRRIWANIQAEIRKEEEMSGWTPKAVGKLITNLVAVGFIVYMLYSGLGTENIAGSAGIIVGLSSQLWGDTSA